MKYIALFDAEGFTDKHERTEFECEDDCVATILAQQSFDTRPGLYTLFRELRQIDQFEIPKPNTVLTEEEKDELLHKMKSILLSHGIRMRIGGCGCCDSPCIAFEYQGEKILDIEGRSLDMFSQ